MWKFEKNRGLGQGWRTPQSWEEYERKKEEEIATKLLNHSLFTIKL